MKEITITTQAELDALPNSFEEYTRIIIRHKPINNNDHIAIKSARGNSSIEIYENSSVVLWEKASVVARDNSSVSACDNSFVKAYGSSYVVAWDNSSVKAYENSSVVLWERASVVAREMASVVARDNSSVIHIQNYKCPLCENPYIYNLNKLLLCDFCKYSYTISEMNRVLKMKAFL